jgi:hypothetical protein
MKEKSPMTTAPSQASIDEEKARFAARTATIQATVHAAAMRHYKELMGRLLVEQFVTLRDLERQSASPFGMIKHYDGTLA